MERDLVESGDLSQALDVVRRDRMISTQYGPEIAHALAAACDALFIEIVAKDVDSVRAAQIVQLISVQVGNRRAGGGLQEGAGIEVLAHHAAKLEWHAIAGRELQICDLPLHVLRKAGCHREALRIQRSELREAGTTRLCDLGRGVVGAEEPGLVVLIERHEPSHPARQARVACHRGVLGTGQLPAPQQPPARHGGSQGEGRGECKGNSRISGDESSQRIVHGRPPRQAYVSCVTLQ